MPIRRTIELSQAAVPRNSAVCILPRRSVSPDRPQGPGVARRWGVAASIAAVVFCGAATEASAQMFGAGRASALSSASGADLSGAGQIRGNERFVRGNRRSGSFIGNDPSQRRNFVGKQSANITGRVRAAAEQAHVTVAPSVNREAASTINRSTGMYEPRLAVGFDVERPSDVQITVRSVLQLHLTLAFPPATRIEVSVADGIATLQGEVSSERDRSLAERLILFEPGIAGVQNELRVLPGSPPTTTAPKPPAKL